MWEDRPFDAMMTMIETAIKVEKIMAFLVETGLSPNQIKFYMPTVEDKADASRRARMRRIISNFLARAIKGAYPDITTYTYFRDEDDVRDYGSACLCLPAVGVYYMVRKRYRNLDVAIIAAQCGVRLPRILQSQAEAPDTWGVSRDCRSLVTASLRREDQELLTWLNLDGPPVVYCSLGSHMLSRVLGPGSLTALVKGILAAPCRVLFVLNKTAREFADADPDFVKLAAQENVKLAEWVNQPAVLAHPSTRLFLSHCGANSLHEALAVGRPILALPFFDDQHYNAAALLEAGCAQRIAKRPVEAQQVTAAVKSLLSPDAKLAAERLQEELLAEDGTLQAAKLVAEKIRNAVQRSTA
eukprot:s599_g13.t1